MIIREIQHIDVPDVTRMGIKVQRLSPYFKRDKINFEKGVAHIKGCVGNPEWGIGFIARNDQDVLLGFILAFVSSPFFSDRRRLVDMLFFCDPDTNPGSAAPRLYKTFRKWGFEHEFDEIVMSITAGIDNDKAEAFYEACGLERIGSIYVDRLR